MTQEQKMPRGSDRQAKEDSEVEQKTGPRSLTRFIKEFLTEKPREEVT